MVYDILPINEQIRCLRREFKAHPENYPPVAERTYRIVIYKSDGTPMRRSEAENESAQSNSFPDVKPVPNGFKKEYVTFDLPQSEWCAYWQENRK